MPNEELQNRITQLEEIIAHILAMKDDAHFMEHPEWEEIVVECEKYK